MDATHRSGADARLAYERAHRRSGENEFGLHSRLFHAQVKRLTKKPLFGSPYLEIRHTHYALSSVRQEGAQIGIRARVQSEELMKLVLRPGDSGANVLWRVAKSECRSGFETYRNHYGVEPDSLSDLGLSVGYLRFGFDHHAPTKALGQFAKRRLKVPQDILQYETEAAFALIEGIAIARTRPEFIAKSDRESGGYVDGGAEAWKARMVDHYEWSRSWASVNRPDLLHLFS